MQLDLINYSTILNVALDTSPASCYFLKVTKKEIQKTGQSNTKEYAHTDTQLSHITSQLLHCPRKSYHIKVPVNTNNQHSIYLGI